MAQKRRGGFKAPANYEPGRKPKGGGWTPRGAAAARAAGRSGAAGSEDERRRGAGEERRRPDALDRRDGAGLKAEASGRRGADGARVFAFDGDGRPRVVERPGSGRGPTAGGFDRLEARKTTAADVAGMTFADLGLGGNIVRTLGELGAERPFPIQAATIPDTIAGRDVLGRARTGSGKTIAFGAALVERLLKLKAEGAFAADAAAAKSGARAQRGVRAPKRPQRKPKALILAPTRELALQIDRTVQPIARSVGFYTAQLVGGVPIDPQVHALERGIDIVIGTPGRIQDLVNRRKLDLREVVVSVIDEADHMCDLGFLDPVQRVLRQTVRGGQRLLFSATLDASVGELISEFLRDPAAHEVEERVATVDHRVLVVLREDKDLVLAELAAGPGRKMIFCRTRAYAERVGEMLADAGVRVATLHGDLSQARRERNLARFTEGKAAVLVATDVAARGIHIDDVDVVLQADPPDDPKTYLHRAGRTGRAGRDGRVLTMIPRTRQQRTREMLEQAEIVPSSFGDFGPGDRLPR
ncbi:DEAD/DEAH box helicase [Leucobacter zeae]|nr:DEAD/DEAH box helicase [Leucobacter zeae]